MQSAATTGRVCECTLHSLARHRYFTILMYFFIRTFDWVRYFSNSVVVLFLLLGLLFAFVLMFVVRAHVWCSCVRLLRACSRMMFVRTFAAIFRGSCVQGVPIVQYDGRDGTRSDRLSVSAALLSDKRWASTSYKPERPVAITAQLVICHEKMEQKTSPNWTGPLSCREGGGSGMSDCETAAFYYVLPCAGGGIPRRGWRARCLIQAHAIDIPVRFDIVAMRVFRTRYLLLTGRFEAILFFFVTTGTSLYPWREV